LLTDWNKYDDKSEFIGEKLISIICLNEYKSHKLEFSEFLHSYDGNYNLYNYSNGWSKVISMIYYSDNIELKKDFLSALENDKVIENILNSQNLDSETLDGIVEYVEDIMGEVHFFIDEDDSFDNANFYPKFKNKKIEFLQDFLDSDDSVEMEVINITEDFDLDYEVERYCKIFIDKIDKMLKNNYEWKDIPPKIFDYSELRYNLGEYLQSEYDSLSDDEDAYDNRRDFHSEERITIASILNKPLMCEY
jgi:hypothetical protein